MNPSQAYYTEPDGGLNTDTIARTCRAGRLELCYAWLVGYMPTWFYAKLAGNLHPGASSYTFRAGRVMLGWRWYI